MTPAEKAREIVDRYFNDYGEKLPNGQFMMCVVSMGRAKQCALIAVDEILELFPKMDVSKNHDYQWDLLPNKLHNYYSQVKEEINKL